MAPVVGTPYGSMTWLVSQVVASRAGCGVTYHPMVITFEDLLDVFFTIHDQTTLTLQDADSGTQCRSAVFFESPEQQRGVQKKIGDLVAEHVWGAARERPQPQR